MSDKAATTDIKRATTPDPGRNKAMSATAPASSISGDKKPAGPVRQKSSEKLEVKREGEKIKKSPTNADGRAPTPSGDSTRRGACRPGGKKEKHGSATAERAVAATESSSSQAQNQNTPPNVQAAPAVVVTSPSKPKKKPAEKKHVVVKKSDMPPDMQEMAISVAKEAIANCKIEKDMATQIKRTFDNKCPNSLWHCIVGQHFGCTVTHETEYLIFFNIDDYHILLFKSQD